MTEPLRVDVEFDAEQQDGVQAAVELWTDATQGRFAPELVVEPVECGEAFAIKAVQTPSCSVGQEVEGSDGRIGHVLGATDPDNHSVAVSASLAGDGFRDAVAHELGHYLMLGHGDGIMSERRQHGESEVSAGSLREFCDIWGC